MNNKNILIVDDDRDIQKLISYQLEPLKTVISCADSGSLALNKLKEETNVVILDVSLPDISGLDLLHKIKKINNKTEVIMLSSFDSDEYVINSVKNGAFWYLKKPCNEIELNNLVQKALESSQLKIKKEELEQAISLPLEKELILGKSKVMLDVQERSKKIAKINTNVFITGESGTGKTTIARHIHNNSKRRTYPFIVVSCVAIPNDLLEAELFGHEKGAFTGAYKVRPGRIEMAHKGTLFLDEIGDLPIQLQAKLLNFIQDKEVKRLGASKAINVDVRIVSATHKNLRQLCKENLFREDLFYRLHVLGLTLPALRERGNDIIELANKKLKRISINRGVECSKLSNCAIKDLLNYSWPGNVRELENELERVTAFINSKIIYAKDFSFNRENRETYKTKEQKSLLEIEKEYILEVLNTNNWNKAKTSRILKISERGLYNKIKRFNLRQFSS
ncbi:UNVERIFIED_CONTAM: hypothetical protein GTU68_041217 [Idotea baltica]|nr:hypothetical protein [Idotea baltica]